MINIWDQRFAQDEYFYGKEPNAFFKKQILLLPKGAILLPAEGEGRNAVFAAKMSWQVTAFDSSIEAKNKAEKLASENNVKIKYIHSSFEISDFPMNFFDVIALIYVHASSRIENHKKALNYLKPGGTIILEGFSKNQINNNTGGPKNVDMLFSEEELQSDFNAMSELKIWSEDIVLTEGDGHTGTSSIIRLIGKK